MGSPTSSQRISFAQLVLDMGLADAKGLAEAKKKIKEAQAEGKKLTIARACVDLGILTEKQAKRVQLELKKLKEGLASSSEFAPDDAQDKGAEKAEKVDRPSRTGKAEKRPSRAGKVDEGEAAEKRSKKKASDEGAIGAKQPDGDDEAASPEAAKVEAPADAKKKTRKDEAEAGEKAATDEAEAKKKGKKDDEAEADAKKKTRKDEAEAEAKKKAKKDDEAEAKKPAKKDDEAEAKKPAKKDDEAEAKKPAKKDEGKKAAAVAEPESDASEPPPSESESEEEAPAAKGKAKGKAVLGKEIQLDSQRAPAATTSPTKSTAKRRATGSLKRTAAATKEEGAATKAPPSKVPLMALGGLVVLLLLGLAIGVAMHDGKDGKPQTAVVTATETPSEPTAPTPEVEQVRPPAPTPDRPPARGPDAPLSGAGKRVQAEKKMDRLSVDAFDLAEDGKLEEAIALLETFPEDLRDQPAWKEVGLRDIEKYKKVLALKSELDAALAAGESGDKAALTAKVKEVEAEGYPFKDQKVVDRFKERAREVLGDAAYERILAGLSRQAIDESLGDLDEVLARHDDSGIEPPPSTEITIETRGSEQRRARMREEARVAQGNLAAAIKTLEERRAARRKAFQAEADRVIKATKKDKLSYEGKEAVVTAYDETGFTIKVGRDEIKFGWGNAPAQLAHDVKFRAIDTSNAQAVFDLGVYATRRGLLDLARRHFERAGQLDSSLKGKAPDLAAIEHLTKLFRGRNKIVADGPSEVQWKFDQDRPQEALDFKPFQDGMEANIVGGQLRVGSPAYSISLARIRGAWKGEAELHAVLTTMSPPPMLGFYSEGQLYAVVFADKTTLATLPLIPNAPPLASSEVRATQGTVVKLITKVVGDKLNLTVRVGDREAFTHQVDWEGPVQFSLGVAGAGEARFDDIVASGRLDPKWVDRTKAAAPNEIMRAVDEWEAKLRAGSGGGGEQIPYSYRKTSAEDDVALEGVSPEAQKLVADGRAALAAGNFGLALKCFEDAQARDVNYHAALFLHAQLKVRQDPDQLFLIERCLKGVEDFYEAMVIKGEAMLLLNKMDIAKDMLAKARELRPDYPPLYYLEGKILIKEGKYREALDRLELADVLGPGDPFITMTVGEARALAEGPRWANRKRVETEHYILDTDFVEHADKLALQLEAIRARYEEAFPNLVNPDAPKRKASVLVFSQDEDYFIYSEATTHDRKENTGGHFNPMTGQLLLFIDVDFSDPGALHVVFHEGMHQWANAQEITFPFWANEGMAEYIGGTILSESGEIRERAAINSFLKGRLKGMTEWNRGGRLRWYDIATQSPQEFYSSKGNNPSFKYGQAWAMVHYFMESGDKVTTIDGDERPIKDVFMDYLNKYKALGINYDAIGGSKLEYVWVETFGQIADLDEVEERFSKYVEEKLAKKAGVTFLPPKSE